MVAVHRGMWEQKQTFDTLKVLADDSRLRIVRLLNEHELSVGEVAARVGLGEPTVSHHLARLREVSLVTLRMVGNQHLYSLNQVSLKRFKQAIDTIEQAPPTVADPVADEAWLARVAALGWSEEDAAILRDHVVNDAIVQLPRKTQKLAVILRWLATLFEAERLYKEKEVNAILKTAFAPDYIGLRRDLVDGGYLRRDKDGSRYWREAQEEKSMK